MMWALKKGPITSFGHNGHLHLQHVPGQGKLQVKYAILGKA